MFLQHGDCQLFSSSRSSKHCPFGRGDRSDTSICPVGRPARAVGKTSHHPQQSLEKRSIHGNLCCSVLHVGSFQCLAVLCHPIVSLDASSDSNTLIQSFQFPTCSRTLGYSDVYSIPPYGGSRCRHERCHGIPR